MKCSICDRSAGSVMVARLKIVGGLESASEASLPGDLSAMVVGWVGAVGRMV